VVHKSEAWSIRSPVFGKRNEQDRYEKQSYHLLKRVVTLQDENNPPRFNGSKRINYFDSIQTTTNTTLGRGEARQGGRSESEGMENGGTGNGIRVSFLFCIHWLISSSSVLCLSCGVELISILDLHLFLSCG
jgi:hypothetical protein